jgi:hypothetical protein
MWVDSECQSWKRLGSKLVRMTEGPRRVKIMSKEFMAKTFV